MCLTQPTSVTIATRSHRGMASIPILSSFRGRQASGSRSRITAGPFHGRFGELAIAG